jgi:hypothetical protein
MVNRYIGKAKISLEYVKTTAEGYFYKGSIRVNGSTWNFDNFCVKRKIWDPNQCKMIVLSKPNTPDTFDKIAVEIAMFSAFYNSDFLKYHHNEFEYDPIPQNRPKPKIADIIDKVIYSNPIRSILHPIRRDETAKIIFLKDYRQG